MGFCLQLFLTNFYLLSIFLISKVFLNLKDLKIYLPVSQLNLFLALQNHFNLHLLSFLFPLHYSPCFHKSVPAATDRPMTLSLSQTIIFNNSKLFFSNLFKSANNIHKTKIKLTS